MNMAFSAWGLFALYRPKEILVKSALKAKKKFGFGHFKNSGAIQGHLGPLVFNFQEFKKSVSPLLSNSNSYPIFQH